MLQIDRVISLGAWCQTTVQIDRYFGRVWWSPFDWTVTPFSSIEAVLADDGERFGLSFSSWDNGKDVRCNEYGLLYHHEFERNPDVTVRFNVETLQACRSKMLHKLNVMRMAVTATGATLFIRFGGRAENPFAWPYVVDPLPLQVSVLNRFCETLDAFTVSQPFVLAILYHPEYSTLVEDEPARPDLMIYKFQRVGLEDVLDEGWKGSDANWNEFFAHCEGLMHLPPRHAV